MTNQEIINAYTQALRTEEVLLLESFLKKNKIPPSEKLLKEIYLEIKASDYYHLLIDRTFKTEEGPVFPYYELTPEGLKALGKYPTLQDYCNTQSLGLRQPEFHKSEKQYPNKPDKTIKTTLQSILKKIYELSNHQIIGGILLAALLAYLARFFK